MLMFDKALAGPIATTWGGEVSVRTLLDMLAPHREKALIFSCEGQALQSGYHVTEVKSGRFDALDCGANPESWTETFIQLWDVPAESGRTFMPVWKFLAIMKKVVAEVPFDLDSKATFEVSDPSSAMRLFGIAGLETTTTTARISLKRRPASCKPRDRWLDKQEACCGPNSASQCCN
jgi:Family of unknown function (DUF6428)